MHDFYLPLLYMYVCVNGINIFIHCVIKLIYGGGEVSNFKGISNPNVFYQVP